MNTNQINATDKKELQEQGIKEMEVMILHKKSYGRRATYKQAMFALDLGLELNGYARSQITSHISGYDISEAINYLKRGGRVRLYE